jgi:hypothetical protein
MIELGSFLFANFDFGSGLQGCDKARWVVALAVTEAYVLVAPLTTSPEANAEFVIRVDAKNGPKGDKTSFCVPDAMMLIERKCVKSIRPEQKQKMSMDLMCHKRIKYSLEKNLQKMQSLAKNHSAAADMASKIGLTLGAFAAKAKAQSQMGHLTAVKKAA